MLAAPVIRRMVTRRLRRDAMTLGPLAVRALRAVFVEVQVAHPVKALLDAQVAAKLSGLAWVTVS
jgi:hypothetical protein